MRRVGSLCLAVALLALVVGCGSSDSTATGGGSTDALTFTPATFKDEWPFTVKEATVTCEGSGSVVLEANGTRYGLNGTAQDQLGLPPIDPIWKEDSTGYGLKVNVGPMLDEGLKLCE